MDRRWGFEEADEVDVRDDAPAAVDDEDVLTGTDADGIVTVTVNDTADVLSVELADGWQDTAVRRVLGAKVVDAMSTATARALAKLAGQIELVPDATPATTSRPPAEESPITSTDVFRLLHTVSTDLGQFRRRLWAVVDETVTVTSGGGHVTVSGRRRQVGDVSIDQNWLYGARVSEVESELRKALTTFCTMASPGELSDGPRSSAISELRALVSDPRAMVRRIRLGSAS